MKFFFVAGFDFGTSYSKVVLRDQFSGVAKVVTFGECASGLLPSLVRVGDSEVAGPGRLERDGILLTYPKLIAADAASGKSDFASLYGDKLKDVLSRLRAKDVKGAAHQILTRYFLSILDAIHDFIAGDEEWQGFDPAVDPLVVQIAVPTGLMAEGDQSVDKLMQGALAAATLLRPRPGQSSPISTVDDLWAATKQLGKLSPADRETLDTRCITYPEVAAGVQTVLRSRNTPDGKYITLDVGAGTVDINAFLRRSRERNEENPGLDYWACEVQPLGFARLDLGRPATNGASHETTVNPLPEADLLKDLGLAINRLMGNAFRFQPYDSEGDGPSSWLGETYAYAWGGGVKHQPYLDRFLSSLQAQRLSIGNVNLLPAPSDFVALPSDLNGNFGRLAIAYGLSYHISNLERVALPTQLKTFSKKYPKDSRPRPPSKDCTCRANSNCPYCFGTGLVAPRDGLIANLAAITTSSATRVVNNGTKPKKTTKHSKEVSAFHDQLNSLFSKWKGSNNCSLPEKLKILNLIIDQTSNPPSQADPGYLDRAKKILTWDHTSAFEVLEVHACSAKPMLPVGCSLLIRTPSQRRMEIKIECHAPESLVASINRFHAPQLLRLPSKVKRSENGKYLLVSQQAQVDLPTATPPAIPKKTRQSKRRRRPRNS